MLPEQLWSVLRRYWAAVMVIIVLCVAGFVGIAIKAQRPYHSSVTLNVQLPVGTANTVYNTQLVLQAVPVIEARLTTADLKSGVEKDTRNYAGSFTVAVSSTTTSSVVGVTVTSINQDLVVPALNSLVTRITKYPGEIRLPVVIQELQLPLPPTRDGASKKVALAAVEGFVFGLALAVFVALLLAQLRRRRDQLGRLEELQGVKTLVKLPEPTEPGAGREDEFVLLAAQLRTEVLNRRATSFAVVSPKNTAVRSAVAAQLARGLAMAGHRVLLVDADLRTPRLEAALASIDAAPIAPFSGMSWLPAETTTVPNLVLLRGTALPRVLDHLDLRGTGPVRLVAGSIAALVAEARAANAVLVVDCPGPDAAESAAVLSAVDAAVVVSAGALRRADGDRLSQLTQTITSLGTEVTGLVVGPRKDYNLRPVPARSTV